MAAPLLYARLVAGFPFGVAPAGVDAVIDLARTLGAELQALLMEDMAALALAELPSPRAFDPRQSLWRDVHRSDLQRELELASAALRRRLEAAQGAGLQAQVTVARGGARAVLEQYAQASDLLVVIEPADAMARWVQPFTGLVEAALASPAALLYLPHRGARGNGPIAAIGSGVVADLAQRLAQALGASHINVQTAGVPPAPRSLRQLLPELHERRARVAVCDREALGTRPQRALMEAGDRRLAVLLAPSPSTE